MFEYVTTNYPSFIVFVVCGVIGIVGFLFFMGGVFMADDPYLSRFHSAGLTEIEVLRIEEENLIFGIKMAVIALVVTLLCAGGIWWGISRLEPEPSFLRKTAHFIKRKPVSRTLNAPCPGNWFSFYKTI